MIGDLYVHDANTVPASRTVFYLLVLHSIISLEARIFSRPSFFVLLKYRVSIYLYININIKKKRILPLFVVTHDRLTMKFYDRNLSTRKSNNNDIIMITTMATKRHIGPFTVSGASYKYGPFDLIPKSSILFT